MRIQMLLACVTLAMGMFFSPASKAACGTDCQIDAHSVGVDAARKLLIADVLSDGQLGKLVRLDAVLQACDSNDQHKAVSKMLVTRWRKLVEPRLNQILGPVRDRTEQQQVRGVSFTSAAEAFFEGYALGIFQKTDAAFKADNSLRDRTCREASDMADGVLLGGAAR